MSLQVSRSWQAATLAPFRSKIFAAIWTASLLSYFGTLIQLVGASWLMTSLAPSPGMVALVQAATALPITLLALPAGAVADIRDRRQLMLIAQSMMLVVSAVLAVLAFLHLITAWSLLLFTFLIGCGAALYGPAWQASVGEQVPASDLPAAIALNSLGFNIARTLGPALGGAIVATSGSELAFTVNALSYLGLIAVLVSWKRPKVRATLPPESVGTAILSGLRYIRLSPALRTPLARSAVFGVLGSAVWALMPLVARDLLGGGPVAYGLLFGAFGGGAVVGALSSTPLRHRYSNEVIVRLASVCFGTGVMICALSPWIALTMSASAACGAGWVLGLSTFNIVIQTSAPRWVVGRALSTYHMLAFGGMAVGSWFWGVLADQMFWGVLADQMSLKVSLFASGLSMATSVLLGFWLPLSHSERAEHVPSRARSQTTSPWPQPTSQVDLHTESGPVVIAIEYRVAAADKEAFGYAMRELGRIRRRNGARRWTLMQDLTDREVFIERFHRPTWLEHLRQHERLTIADLEVEQRALAFHRGSQPPYVRHLLQQIPGELASGRKAEVEIISPRGVVTDPTLPPAVRG
jgi:MFS family permease